MNKMGAKEFRDLGYLQEINRQFLHPRGLALEVVVGEDGSVRFGEVWDYRDDPEGIRFGDAEDLTEHAARVHEATDARRSPRVQKLGYWIQPA